MKNRKSLNRLKALQRFLFRIPVLILVIISCFSLSAQERPEQWTHFRGSGLNGVAPGSGFPHSWSDSSQVKWKIPVKKGWSSPVILGSQIWLTYDREEKRELRALCLDKESGQIIHDLLIFRPDSLYRKHSINTYSTCTAALEGDEVYLHFGRYGTACLNRHSGQRIWERRDLSCEHVQGPGSSLLIYKDLLILHIEGTDVQYLVALDKKSGKTIWTSERPKALYDPLPEIGKKAYTTAIIQNVDGRDLLISNGSAVCIAYDPLSGKEIWRVVQGEDSTISMPVAGKNLVYFYTSFVTTKEGEKYAELLAVDPRGKGDIGESHVRWRMKAPILQLATPVLKDGLLYTVDSKNYFYVLDAENGQVRYSERLKGKYHSSPIWADGHIYLSSTRGFTRVYQAGESPEFLAENRLEGEIWATPAFVDSCIYLRTSDYLYGLKVR